MQKDSDDPYLVTMQPAVPDMGPSDAGPSGVRRDFDASYDLMVRKPKYALICYLTLLLLARENGPLYFDLGLAGMFAVLSTVYLFFASLIQLVATPHALWLMFKNGWLRSWRHWLVVFCGIAVFALGVFVSARFGLLKSLARDLLS
jgi:hypothetical protein